MSMYVYTGRAEGYCNRIVCTQISTLQMDYEENSNCTKIKDNRTFYNHNKNRIVKITNVLQLFITVARI